MNCKIYKIFSIILLVLININIVFAIDNTFEIKALVGGETTSTPSTTSTTTIPVIQPQTRSGKPLNKNISSTTPVLIVDLNTAPQNVLYLRAVLLNNVVVLDWQLPLNNDITEVRVVKSDHYFPRGVYEGELISVTLTETVKDFKVEYNKKYFYTVFTKNSRGFYSSGSIVSISIGENIPEIDFDKEKGFRELSSEEYWFSQNEIILNRDNGKILASTKLPISLNFRDENIPNSSEIQLNIFSENEQKNRFSQIGTFFLAFDKSKSINIASIPPLEEGEYKAEIRVFLGLEHKVYYRAIETINVQNIDIEDGSLYSFSFFNPNLWLISLILSIILVILLKILKRLNIY
ncbi:MAG: hypothetical protein Q7R78_03150 [bacterium]|nr:hypothetical protein [bacterium]